MVALSRCPDVTFTETSLVLPSLMVPSPTKQHSFSQKTAHDLFYSITWQQYWLLSSFPNFSFSNEVHWLLCFQCETSFHTLLCLDTCFLAGGTIEESREIFSARPTGWRWKATVWLMVMSQFRFCSSRLPEWQYDIANHLTCQWLQLLPLPQPHLPTLTGPHSCKLSMAAHGPVISALWGKGRRVTGAFSMPA